MLGRYQLLEPIGAGGMGRVWVAREMDGTARGRLFAIKTALAESNASTDFWKLMMDEAQIASQIEHPNVCRIHSFDHQAGLAYLVMDYCDGLSLRQLLDALPEKRLYYTIAARIATRALAGLHAAHELRDGNGEILGVVHRDVSPQNVLISRRGHVSLIDFGVAKSRAQMHAPTQTGEVKGKLSYMAPEQVTTKNIDRRADVFAMGSVLYEASLGIRPFHGDDALATMYQLLEQPLRKPSELDPTFPPELEAIIVRSLEKNPADRYQSADEMQRALEQYLSQQGEGVGELDIERLLTETVGEMLEARAQALEVARHELRAGPRDANSPAERASLAGNVTPAPTASETAPRARSTGTQRVLWLAAGLVAIAGSFLLISRRQPPEPTSTEKPGVTERFAAASPAPSSAPSAQPTAPTTITLTLRADPKDAEIIVDGGLPLANPATLTVPVDDRPHRISARARGYREQSEELRFDRDREVVLVLPLAARASTTTPGQKRPVETTTVRTAETREPDGLPVVKKPPRTLDNENPFARTP